MAERYPKRGDRFDDQMGSEPMGLGTITGYGSDGFFLVKYDVPRAGPDGVFPVEEEIEETIFEPHDKCGWGRWDEQRNLWVLEHGEDALPADHPDVLTINQMFANMNAQLAADRAKRRF